MAKHGKIVPDDFRGKNKPFVIYRKDTVRRIFMSTFNESHLKVLDGGQAIEKGPQKATVCFCSYVDKNGRKALLCEVAKFTVVYTFYSISMKKYATVTLSAGRKRLSKFGADKIVAAWEEILRDGDMGPKDYGRCFLSENYGEASRGAFSLVHELIYGPYRGMSDEDTKLCVQVFSDLLMADVSEAIGLKKEDATQ